jgi:hypothetical protein
MDKKKRKFLFNGKNYELEEDSEEFILIDKSDDKIKVDISFSKDPIKNKIAKDGLTIFFTEIFS